MGIKRFFRRNEVDRQRIEEIESYVQLETDENIARGMTPDAALWAARKKFGNSTLVREEIYRMNTMLLFDTISRNIRYAVRALRHNPMFTATALLTIAIGIGANTAVFSVVNSVLLKPLNYPKANDLVALRQVAPGAAGLANFADGLRLSPSMYFTYAEHNRAFQSLGVWFPGTASVTRLAEPEQVRAVWVSDGVLQALGVPPAVGRWLSAADQIPQGPATDGFSGRSAVVMLSYGYWQQRFGGDPSVIGRKITVDSDRFEIVGVMPRGFRIVSQDADLIVPIAFDRAKVILAGFGFQGIARLKPGITIAQANADMARMLPIWMDSWSNGPGTDPKIYETWRITPTLLPLKDELVGNVRDVLWVVMATIGLVMLIACANVTNLLMVRAEARQQELAVRTALGAGKWRVFCELLTESVLLGLGGGVLGLGVAAAGVRLLMAIGPSQLPRLAEISLDARSLGFALLLSLLSGLLFGLIPAWKYAGPRISIALRSAGRTSSVSRDRHRVRNLLVVAQIALALVLMISAGLMIRTFQALRTVDPGFTQAEHLQMMRISIPESLAKEPDRAVRIQNEIADKLAAIPGVTAAGYGSEMPMEGFEAGWDCIFVEGRAYSNNEIPPLQLFKYVSPGFFKAAGTRLVAGRELSWKEIYAGTPVAMVSENLAREFWGTASSAVGKRFRESPGMEWQQVIGVVQDVRENGIQEKAPNIVYWAPLTKSFNSKQYAVRSVTFVLRNNRTDTEGFISQIRQAVWSVNSDLPLASVRTMQDVYDHSLARTSFTLVMLGIAGGMALLLGIIGIYGVIAYTVSQRTREIGIRLALGAQEGELKRMFVRHGLALAGVGVVVGLGAAMGLMRLLKSLLFGISPLDPLTYIAVPAVLVLATLFASYLPARRASAVDPVNALRGD